MFSKYALIIFLWYFVFSFVNLEYVTISPNLNAFNIFKKNDDFKKKFYAYTNPITNDFNVSMELGKIKNYKHFSKSNMSVTIHAEKYQFFDLEKVESYTINLICKFNYNPDRIYHYHNICCRITVQDFNYTQNDFYSVKYCKFTLNRYSSACFSDLNFMKSFIPKPNGADHFYYGLRAFVFATTSGDCNMSSDIKEILAVSKLYPISFSNGMHVYWTNTFESHLNMSLEIGRSFNAFDPESLISLPIKLITEDKFSYLRIKCFISENLEIKSINFDENMFENEYEVVNVDNQWAVTVILQVKNPVYQKSSPWWVGKGLLLFILNGRISDSSMSYQMKMQNEVWIKCQIFSKKEFSEPTPFIFKSAGLKQISVPINEGKLIIIPILEQKSHFVIFNDIDRPIDLGDNFVTLYSIHNVRDGSFVDVSNSATCDPIDKNSISCPKTMLKSTNTYFHSISNTHGLERTRIYPFKFDLILQMKSWKAVIFSPIDVWIAQDWRLEIVDKVLSKIQGWRVPIRSTTNKQSTCQLLFQKTSIKVLARLVNINTISEKEFFGTNGFNEAAPLIDVTSQMPKEVLELSSSNAKISFNEKFSELVVDQESDSDKVDIRLMSLNSKRLLAIERVKVSLDPIQVLSLKLFCFSDLNIYQDSKDRLSNFREFITEYALENDTNKNCYLVIIIIFSDLSEMRLDETSSDYYRIQMSHLDYSSDIIVQTYLHFPFYVRYSPEMNISVLESDNCQNTKLIFGGLIKVNGKNEIDLPLESVTSPKYVTRIFTEINQTKMNQPEIQTKELLKNLSALYYGLYSLVALVSIVIIIVVVNCLVKFNYLKSLAQRSNSFNQVNNNKLLNTDQPSSNTDNFSPSFFKHPPLLPPPGPLRTVSTSEVELGINIFWSNPSSQPYDGLINKKISNSLMDKSIPLSTISNISGSLVSSVCTNTNHLNHLSPSSSQGDGGYFSGDYQSSLPQQPIVKILSNDLGNNHEQFEMISTNLNVTNYPITCTMQSCPQSLWPIQWTAAVIPSLPVFTQSETALLIPGNACMSSRILSGPTSSSASHWTNNKINMPLNTVPYTKSIDNLCEKSSGVGSLTSTQHEDYSVLSDDDHYHAISSDKEQYKDFFKK